MKETTMKYRYTLEEKETLIQYDGVDKCWHMDSNISKHFNKALKNGWTPTQIVKYEDGTVCAMKLVAPENAVSIRNPNKKRVLSEEHLQKLNSARNKNDSDCSQE